MRPKVSVIIAVYNSSATLAKCLDSVRSQTLRDIEIICVNDCSKDASLNILEEFSKIDSRIVIINNKINLGCGATKDVGILYSSGEYFIFLDDDDYLDNDYLEKCYLKAKKTKAKIVRGYMDYCFKDNSVVNPTANLQSLLSPFSLNCSSFINLIGFFYDADYFKDNKLSLKYRIYDDMYLMLKLYAMDIKLVFIHNSFYHYCPREHSLSDFMSSDVNNVQNMIDFIDGCIKDSTKFSAKRFKKYMKLFLYVLKLIVYSDKVKKYVYYQEFIDKLDVLLMDNSDLFFGFKEYDKLINDIRTKKVFMDNEPENKTLLTRARNFVKFKILRPIHNNLLPRQYRGIYYKSLD